jgi:hypothetical protein
VGSVTSYADLNIWYLLRDNFDAQYKVTKCTVDRFFRNSHEDYVEVNDGYKKEGCQLKYTFKSSSKCELTCIVCYV